MSAIDNTTFVLDAPAAALHRAAMSESASLLSHLREKGVTQEQIAKVIGISQSGAATLYTLNKNGKLRKLSYDEGAALVREFSPGYFGSSAVDALAPLQNEAIEAALEAAVLGGWRGQVSEDVLQGVAHAIGGALRSFQEKPDRLTEGAVRESILGIVADSVSQTMKKQDQPKANTLSRKADNPVNNEK